MLRIMPFMPPCCIFFIIFCIWVNCLSRRFTSCTWVPEPAAIRFLREPLMRSGF
ncbi:Uncharacterised protein [Vibrio cholerae]|uniref:Uncharacterized protein n=1 Tax=Vibrio cholerae TaxID=666 RepID=A0A655ZA52_VIBCL|nr:Uncharacterised protein [Vibrio cholerae]CSD19215.1 Uncharacterised protein [Vibrio cholerae]